MCENVLFLTVFKIVDMLLTVSKIILPLLIIVKSSMDFFKPTISGNSDDIVKAGNTLLMRLASALFIFLLPTIVNIAMQMTVSNIDTSSADCLFNVTDEMIENAKVKAANKAIEIANSNLTQANYQDAKSKVDALSEGAAKDTLNTAVNSVQKELQTAQEKEAELAAARVAAAKKIQNTTTPNTDVNIKLDGTDVEIIGYITKRYDTIYSALTVDEKANHPYYQSYCGKLVCDQLEYEGLIDGSDRVASGCDQAKAIASGGKTGTGHTVVGYEMYSGANYDYDKNCEVFESMIAENGGTLENVVISYAANENLGPYGHVCLITKIADGKVYLIDNVLRTKNPEHAMYAEELGIELVHGRYYANVMSISDFEGEWFRAFHPVYMAHVLR